jgi:4-hydroxy-tetrahydrodipicolinate synthase
MSKKLEGIFASLIIPFKENRDLDLNLVREEIKTLVKVGVHGISTGEGSAVADEEMVALVKLIREITPDIPIVAGIIRNSTRAALKTARMFQEAVTDALMITPVFY